MISITKTVYPRFKKMYREEDLEKIFQPSEEELELVLKKVRGKSQKLTFLTLLKCHQHLGYLPAIKSIPKSVSQYLSNQLGYPTSPPLVEMTETNKKSFHRYRTLIRKYLKLKIKI